MYTTIFTKLLPYAVFVTSTTRDFDNFVQNVMKMHRTSGVKISLSPSKFKTTGFVINVQKIKRHLKKPITKRETKRERRKKGALNKSKY